MFFRHRFAIRLVSTIGLCTVLTGLISARSYAETDPVNTLSRFFSLTIGGYFIPSSSGRAALGSQKFFDEGQYLGKPAHRGFLAISGGLETMTARDHLLPFTGGNEFSLIGPVLYFSSSREYGHLKPFLSAGYDLGRLRSGNLGIDSTQLVPAMSVGLEYHLSKRSSIRASYRLSRHIDNVNTDGFGISFQIF